MFRLKDVLMALSNDTSSGGAPSADTSVYSGLDKGPQAYPQPPKDKYSIHTGTGPIGQTVNATSDGEIC
jgi:hypothetical protein